MQNGDKGLPRISLAACGHMLITLWVGLISKYIPYIKGHNAVWLGKFRIKIIINNKNNVTLNNLIFFL